MSVPVNLEYLRKQAKSLLKLCRSGDAAALNRVRQRLNRFQNMDDATALAEIRLADVHHALALEQGCRSWADLKRQDDPAARFLAAVRGGNLESAQRVLEEFPELSEDSIHAASALGDADAVRYHLRINKDLVRSEAEGWPPLLYACASRFHKLSLRNAMGIVEVATLLLDHGADPNSATAADAEGKRIPAMGRAQRAGNRVLPILLVQRGAERGDWRQFFTEMLPPPEGPLERMLQEFLKDPSFREELRKRIPPPPERDKQSFQKRIASLKEAKTTRNIFEYVYQLDTPSDSPSFAHPFAGEYWRVAFERGLDPNLRYAAGDGVLHRTPLLPAEMAVRQAEIFLENGADPNLTRPDGKTPVSIAVRHGRKDLVALLVARGGKLESAGLDDQLLGACRQGDVDTAIAIARAQPEVVSRVSAELQEFLMQSSKHNTLATLRALIETGVNLSAEAPGGVTALHLAAWFGRDEAVRLLVESGAPVDRRDGVCGTSPLAWAAHGSRNCRDADADYAAVVRALFAAGASYAAAVNRWDVAPESVASPVISDLIAERRPAGWA
jgi:ankyrin repeat protein